MEIINWKLVTPHNFIIIGAVAMLFIVLVDFAIKKLGV